MRREMRFLVLVVAILVAAGLTACQPPEEEQQAAADGGEEWAWLNAAKPELDAKRAKMARLRAGEPLPEDLGSEAAATAEAAAGDAASGDTASGDPAAGGEPRELNPDELADLVTATKAEVDLLADEFGRKLVTFINSQDITVGEAYTEIQRQAIDWKIDEDILYAQEYIDEGGDYQRAIDIYNQSMVLDPGNEKLTLAIEKAEQDRYMTEERFAQVKKKMTEGEVREILGQPKTSNIRDFEKGVVGWFYKKADGGAAGVFFRQSKGQLRVYQTDFNAVERQVVGDEGEESAEVEGG